MFLAEREKTQEQWAGKIGITPTQFSAALHVTSQRFSSHRHRLRIERELGRALWNEPAECEQLAAIGKTLGVDLLTATLSEIRRAAEKRGVKGLTLNPMQPWGLPMFASLLAHFFPESRVPKLPHYTTAAKATPQTAGATSRHL